MSNDDIDKFDIEQADKLLRSIRMLGDLKSMSVPKADSDQMEETTLRLWMRTYHNYIEWNGGTGYEHQVVQLIDLIDNNVQLIASRAEEGFRRLLTVLDKKALEILEFEKRVEQDEKIIKSLNDRLVKVRMKLYEYGISEEDVEVDTAKPAPIPKVIKKKAAIGMLDTIEKCDQALNDPACELPKSYIESKREGLVAKNNIEKKK